MDDHREESGLVVANDQAMELYRRKTSFTSGSAMAGLGFSSAVLFGSARIAIGLGFSALGGLAVGGLILCVTGVMAMQMSK